MPRLIEALPDEVALRCLAYVPLHDHPNVELVSRSWLAAIRSDHLFNVRKEVKSSENLLCVCAFEPQNIWQVYSPTCDRWLSLPRLPCNSRHLAYFEAVTTGRKLFVLGGGNIDPLREADGDVFPTNEVWCYDFVERKWTRRASMLVPRAVFASCVLDGKIIVAGCGFANGRKSLYEAEIYNPDNDLWTPLPDLQETFLPACSGLVLNDKVHVFHKTPSTVQVLESVELGWVLKDHDWPDGQMTVIEDVPYVLSERLVFKLEGGTWKMIASTSEFKSRVGMFMTSLGEELLILGGEIRQDPIYWDFKSLSDVNALTVVNDRTMWRNLAPMSRCCGAILACTQLKI